MHIFSSLHPDVGIEVKVHQIPKQISSQSVFRFMVISFYYQVCLATHQWIFNAVLNHHLPPAFCIRHDVDALLWQPKAQPNTEANNYWTHVGTFNALGYVQAAKQDRKFSTCAPNMSFATLCDCTRHVYVYQQPEKGVTHATQYVVTLGESENEILGLQASNDRVFVLTKQSLHVVNMK